MFGLRRNKDEQGFSAIIVGLSMTALMAAAGIGIDFGNLAYQKTVLQKSVDNASLSVATDCAASVSCPDDAQQMASDSVLANSDASSLTRLLKYGTQGPKSVTVEASRHVSMSLGNLIGIKDRDITATATAKWDAGHPVEGYNVFPLGVSYCTFEQRAGLGTLSAPYNSGKMLLRTDTLQAVNTLASGLLGSAAIGDLTLASLTDALTQSTSPNDGPPLTSNCAPSGPYAGALSMQGAVWLSNLADSLGVTLNNNDPCKLKIQSITTTVTGLVDGTISPNCAKKFNDVSGPIHRGDTILLPIYVPADVISGLPIKLGLPTLPTCSSISVPIPLLGLKPITISGLCLKIPSAGVQLGVRIVGYAPFKVTGAQFGIPGSGFTDLTSPTLPCNSIGISVNVRDVLTNLLEGPVGALLGPLRYLLSGIVSGVVDGLLSNVTDPLHASVGCNGISGNFVKTFTQDPNFKWSTDGPDIFGATSVHLVN